MKDLLFRRVTAVVSVRYYYLIILSQLDRKIVSATKSPSVAVSPSRPSSSVLPQLLWPQSRPGPLAAFSGRGFDMIRSVAPHSKARTYSGVLQSGVSGQPSLTQHGWVV